MARIRSADQALRFIARTPGHLYVCRICRAHANRQFHTSPILAAEMPFLTRIQQTLFGPKKLKETEEKQEGISEKKTKKLAKRDGSVKQTLRVGQKVYDLAPVVDPAVNTDYIPATTWDNLERIGSREYVKAQADRGEKYVGYGAVQTV